MLEVVAEEGTRYQKGLRGISHLRNWYSPVVSHLSLPLARLVCQRTNPWWDSRLRKHYAAALKVLLGALGVFVLALGIHRGMTLDVFVLSILAPLTPAILWGARETRKNSSEADELQKLQAHIDERWKIALSGSLSGDRLLADTIAIQDRIFYCRSKNPLVFNWVYWLLRPRQETTMRDVATRLVDQALHERRSTP